MRFNYENLSDQQLDLRTLEVIPLEWQQGEQALYLTKWWDYRFDHPMRATYRFADAYEYAFREISRRLFDMSKEPKVFGAVDPMRDTEKKVLGLWKARRTADELGIEYRFYCLRALDFSERLAWKSLARPDELANQALVERVFEQWEGELKARLMIPKDGRYGGSGGYYQKAFETWMCNRIRTRPSWKRNVNDLLDSKHLTEATIIETLGELRLRDALAARI